MRWVIHAEQCALKSVCSESGPDSCTWPVLVSSHCKPSDEQIATRLLFTPMFTREAWLSVGTSDDITIAKATIKAWIFVEKFARFIVLNIN